MRNDDSFMTSAIVCAVLIAVMVWWAIHGTTHIPTVYDIPRLEKRIQQLEADRAR